MKTAPKDRPILADVGDFCPAVIHYPGGWYTVETARSVKPRGWVEIPETFRAKASAVRATPKPPKAPKRKMPRYKPGDKITLIHVPRKYKGELVVGQTLSLKYMYAGLKYWASERTAHAPASHVIRLPRMNYKRA